MNAARLRLLLRDGPGLGESSARTWAAEAGVEIDVRRGDAVSVLSNPGPVDGIVVAPGGGGFQSDDLAGVVAAAGVPVVAVEPGNLRKAGVDPAATPVGRTCARVLYGRGPDVWGWAVRHLAWRTARPYSTHAYGSGRDQVGDLRLPEGPGPHPVAVLVHGGFWHHVWERDLMDGLAVDLARRAWATWNLEYRRVGADGGWPTTGDDVAAGIDHLVALAPVHRLDLDRVTLVGHSAGAQLVLWAGGRPEARVRARLVCGLAAVCDLRAARAGGVGGRAVERLVEGAPDRERALDEASPATRLPLGVRQLLAHAADDPLVPVSQSRAYAAAARATGDEVELLELETGRHLGLIDPRSAAWAAVVKALQGLRR